MSIQGVNVGIRRKKMSGFAHPPEKGIIYAASTMHVKKKKPVQETPVPEPTPAPVVVPKAVEPPKPELKPAPPVAKVIQKTELPYGIKELPDKSEA